MIIKMRSKSPPGLIIKDLDNQTRKNLIIIDNQSFHHVSPNLCNSEDDSPDQTVDRIKIYDIFPFSPSTTQHPDFHWLGLTDRANRRKKLHFEAEENLILVRTSDAEEDKGDGGSATQKLWPAPLSDVSEQTELPSCDDKGVYTDDDDTYRKCK